MGTENNEKVQAVFEKYPHVFEELLDAARQKSACTKGDQDTGKKAKEIQVARPEIEKIVEVCTNCDMPLNEDSKTSGFKDMLGAVTRLLLGEIFSETFPSVSL